MKKFNEFLRLFSIYMNKTNKREEMKKKTKDIMINSRSLFDSAIMRLLWENKFGQSV